MPAVELTDVSFSYSTSNPVLKNITLRVYRGDFLAIIGPNGGGKTTLLRLILGILKPDEGRIKVFGTSPENARGNIGYVPQLTSSGNDFPVSAMDVVLMGRLHNSNPFRSYSKTDRNKAIEKLEIMRINDLADEQFEKLSGGQKQRVFIARALVGEPELLLLDEPVASVDPTNQESFFHLLNDLNEKVTIILVTHDVGAVSSFVKSIACLNIHMASHEEMLTPETLKRVYGCPIDLITHGVPHRVLGEHGHPDDSDD